MVNVNLNVNVAGLAAAAWHLGQCRLRQRLTVLNHTEYVTR